MFSSQLQSVAVGSDVLPRPGYSLAYRHYKYTADFVRTIDKKSTSGSVAALETYHDLLLHAEANHGSVPGIGSRPIISIHTEARPLAAGDLRPGAPSKKWSVAELGPYVWIKYADFARLALTLSKALVVPLKGPGAVACIYSKTSAEWQLAAHACFAQSATICTAYESLGVEGLQHVLGETESSVIFLQPELTETFIKCYKSCKSPLHALKTIVLLSPVLEGRTTPASETQTSTITEHTKRVEQDAREKLLQELPPESITVTSLKELLDTEFGSSRESLAAATRPPSAKDLACIMYTSGSTGPPKGVMMTHANLIAATASITVIIADLLRGTNDVYLAYLPCAHVMEFVLESTAILNGVVVGYGSPRTLTDAMVRNCKGDMRELRPTLLVGVPSVWDAVAKGLLAKVERMPFPIRFTFSAATKLKRLMGKFDTIPGISFLSDILDATLLRKIQEQVGGRLRMGLSGGASLSVKSQLLLCGALVPIHQGYGLTETCASALSPIVPGPITLRCVGVPVPSVEVRLRDVPELGYFVSDNCGELQIRGASIFAGYYKRKDLDAESFEVSDDSSPYRWFSTGDVARRDPKDGQFYIIDRVKNLIKLSNGEYVAVESIESVLTLAPIVARMCIIARSTEPRVCAVFSPNPTELEDIISHHYQKMNGGVDGENALMGSWEDRCTAINDAAMSIKTTSPVAKAVYAEIMRQITSCGQEASLLTSNIPAAVILSHTEWLPESGYVTAAMKLNRRHIETLHASQIDELFSKSKR